MGSETYTYVDDGGGTCDPDVFGGARAFLTRIDDSGEPIGYGDGLTEGVTISVSADGQGVIAGSGGDDPDRPVFTAGQEGDPSSIDSVDISDRGASGTATFLLATDELVPGTFEFVCAGQE
ncbi:MAG TPA: hypothetical protein VJ978_04640 [Nitriliruptoraceae bacterium]|nr:hypothetical protein [Nitriliruptoraceae bacterium]